MRFTNLTEILEERKTLGDIGITFIDGNHEEELLSYQALYHAALKALSVLQGHGMQPKDELVLQIGDNKTFIIVFWACILGGIIPVPVSVGQNDDHKQKLFNIWSILNNPHIIISSDSLDHLEVFAVQVGLDQDFREIRNKVIDEAGILFSQEYGKIFPTQTDDIAFVQFSSGSTGSPKGVILTHRNLITNMQAITNAAGYTSNDSMISWMPLTHDMGLIGFHLNPLFCGMPQYLIPTNLFIRNPLLWLDKTSEHKANIIASPNFGYRYFLKYLNDTINYNWNLSQIRIIYNGAEPISVKLCRDFLKSLSKYGLRINSMCPVYGLAEATLAVSISVIEDEVISIDLDRNKLSVGDDVLVNTDEKNSVSFVNVGKPIDYCSIKIVDNQNCAVGNEIIGQIQIKGNNVTSGYYNNPIETKNVIGEDGWLSTGDLGFTKDNALFITGRAKDIIFVNGRNYYSHDIERVAEAVDGVELNKIVVAGFFNMVTEKEEAIAFIFHRGSLENFVLIAESLRSLVNSQVGFEIDRILPVKDIPKTTSGKLRRFKLLEQYKHGFFRDAELKLSQLINRVETGTGYTSKPENEIEQKLIKIWGTVLQRNPIDITDRFFAIGGNSLKAAEMGMALQKEFQVDLSFKTIYEKQTIREIAKEILTRAKQPYVPIPIAPASEYYPVSSTQKRIYFLWEVDKFSIGYNMPVAFKMNGKIEIVRLESCIKQLIARHDAFRMSFRIISGQPVFKIHPDVDFSLKCITCNVHELNDKLKSLVHPFDLTAAPLFRTTLVKVFDDVYTLFVDFSHIISDGVSLYHFVEELLSLYDGNELPALSIGYKDYAAWEKENLRPEKLQSLQTYWVNRLEGELPVLEMPLDFQRPIIFSYAGEKIPFDISRATTARLNDIAKTNDCTLHVLIFTLYNIFLTKYTGQEDIIIGIPVAGRTHPDLHNIQGMFVNNIAIRSIVRNDETFAQLLATVKNNIVDALNNQEYSFEKLTQVINRKRDVSRNFMFLLKY